MSTRDGGHLPLVVADWATQGLGRDLDAVRHLLEKLEAERPAVRLALCPPATLIERLARVVEGSSVLVGGQDVHPAPCGPYTGDISASLLKDAGAELVLVGHPDRRHAYGEDDALVARKAAAAMAVGLWPVVGLERKASPTDLWSEVEHSLPPGLEGATVAGVDVGWLATAADEAEEPPIAGLRLLLMGDAADPALAREAVAAGAHGVLLDARSYDCGLLLQAVRWADRAWNGAALPGG